MVTIGMNYRVIEGKQQDFIAMFNKVLELMNEIEGHTRSALYRDVNDGCSFLIVSEWTDQQAFDGFIGSDRFAKVANWGKTQILAGRPSHTVYSTQAPLGGSKPASGGCPMH